MNLRIRAAAAAIFVLPHPASAQAAADLAKVPVAVSTMQDVSRAAADEVSERLPGYFVAALARSARFRATPASPADLFDRERNERRFREWFELGADLLISGSIRDLPDGRRIAECLITDTATVKDIHSVGYVVTGEDWKQVPDRCLADFEAANGPRLAQLSDRRTAIARQAVSAKPSSPPLAKPPVVAQAGPPPTRPRTSSPVKAAALAIGPSARDIERLFVRLTAQMSRRIGAAPDDAYLKSVNSFGGEILRVYISVSDRTCAKLSATSYRCSYTVNVERANGGDGSLSAATIGFGDAFQDAMLGRGMGLKIRASKINGLLTLDSFSRTDVFLRGKGGLESPGLEKAIWGQTIVCLGECE